MTTAPSTRHRAPHRSRARRSSPAPAPQLRRALRGQRACARRPHRQHLDRSARRWQPEHAAAARLRARRRPDRAHLSSRPAAISACAGSARAARGSSSASPGTRRWTRSRARCCACARRYGNAAILDCLAHRHAVDAARPCRGAALPVHVRRLHRSVVEHVGRGRGVRRAHDLRRQGRLQGGRPRADRLRQFAS